MRYSSKWILIHLIVLFLFSHKSLGQTIVTNGSELNSAIQSAVPGTVIVLADKVWTSTEININKQGTLANPITIKAQTPGSVFFEGNSSVHLGGSYIRFEGVIFRNASGLIVSSNRIDPIIEFRDNSNNECHHCKVTNVKIDSYNGTSGQSTATFKWILVYGQYNEISYCSFLGKYGIGSVINDNRNDDDPNYTSIHHNYFADRTPVGDFNALNDQDAIRIGNSSTSLSDSYTEVYNNYFNNWSGEIEIISNKSGANKYYNNTFRNYQGCLTLRHGNGNEVYGNYFFANQNNTTAGIRIIGENQLVYNNYIEGINSLKEGGSLSGATGGINVTNGRENTELNGYFQVINSKIVNNTFVNCDYAIRVGTKVAGDLTLAPENLIIANNIMLNSSNRAISVTTAPIGTSSYEGNITQNGSWDITTGTNNNVVSSANLLTSGSSFYRLGASSIALDAGVGSYSFLTKDILGGTRAATYDAGAEEFGSTGTNEPYTDEDIGVNVGFQTNVDPVVFAEELYISEVLFGPGGSDDPREFVEIRSTAGATIPAMTYLAFIEGDPGGSTGKVKMYFDLSGLVIGANGYLAFTLDNNGYTYVDGSNVIEADVSGGGVAWEGQSLYTGSGTSGVKEIEDVSENVLLVTTTSPIATSQDIDTNDDGVIDVSGWTIHDGVSVLDSDHENGGNEFGYAPIIFSQALIDTKVTYNPASSTIVQVDFKGGYFCRIGESTGSTAADWVCAETLETGQVNKFFDDTYSNTFRDVLINEVGGPNWSDVTYAGSFVPHAPKDGSNLTIESSLSSAEDYKCRNLTINTGQTFTIAAGHTLTVNGNLTVDGSLVIESGASLITKDGNTIGAVTINRNTHGSALGYSFVGSPVTSDAGITGASIGTITYAYDETQAYNAVGGSRWINAASTQLLSGVGYAQAGQNTLSFTGVPNDGTITVPGLTYSTGTANEQGWNLLSNPYPTSISAQAFADANTTLDAAIYLWNDPQSGQGSNSDYLTVTSLGAVNGNFNGYIGSAQGFFVKVAAPGTVSATFTEAMRTTGNNADANFFRKADTSPLNIKLAIESESKGYYNELLIGLRDDATIGMDRNYDAVKLIGNTDLQFYSLINDNKYAIQGLPRVADIATELAFNLSEASELTLSVVELSGLPDGMTFLLTDKLTGKVYDLNAMNSFDFSAAKGSDQNRFTLTYAVAGVLENKLISYQPVYRYLNNQLLINFNKSVQVEGYIVYDISGKTIHSDSAHATTNEMHIPITTKGINIIRIVTSEGVFTRKFLL